MCSEFKATCVVCSSRSWALLYDGKIRDGSYGKMSVEPMQVYECTGCHLARLHSFVIGQNEYESPDYRERYNDSSNDRVLLSMHDPEQASRVALMGFDKLRDKVILDYGCGHGAFLDAVAGVAAQTVAVEPLKTMHPSLRERGHAVYGSSTDALSEYRGRVQVLTSFGVIEHVEDPANYLRDAFDLLAENGLFVLQTDNADDILMKTAAKEFAQFFYRTAHNWYFRPPNLERLVTSTGFGGVSTQTSHSYDFSNFLLWHQQGRPTGIGKLKLFDSVFEQFWKVAIEAAGYGDLITVIARKPAK